MQKDIVSEALMSRILDRIANEILERYEDTKGLCLIGIKTRGVHIAKRLQDKIEKFSGVKLPLGELDITLYRDDLTTVAADPQMKAANIGFDVNGKNVIIVDDVLYTGRTVRCALDAIMDCGRPRKVELIVLVDRGHREIPVMADYVGKNVVTADDDIIHVHIKEHDGDDRIVHNIGGQHKK